MKRILIVILLAIFVAVSFIFITRNFAATVTSAADYEGALKKINRVGGRAKSGDEMPFNLAMSGWLNQAAEQINLSEYLISRQQSTYLEGVNTAYQAPNRAHNLRTYFLPDGIQILRRTDSNNSWILGLNLQGNWNKDSQHRVTTKLISDQNRIEYQHDELIEWYSNDSRGLMQGYLLAKPLGSGEELELEVNITGDLNPHTSADHTRIMFSDTAGEVVLQYGDLQAFDESGKALPVRLRLVSNQDGNTSMQIIIGVSDVSYPVYVVSMITNPSILESGSGLSQTYDWGAVGIFDKARFGYSVSSAGDVNGDGFDDVIIGAPYFDYGHQEEGAAFLYLGGGDGLSLISDYRIEANQDRAHVGISVSGAGENDSHTSNPDSGNKGTNRLRLPSVWLPIFFPWACNISINSSVWYGG